MELEYNTGGSPVSIIRLFSREGSDNCVAVRPRGEQSCAGLAGRNDNEPHLRSLETNRTRKPSLWVVDEGRRELYGVNRLEMCQRLKQLTTVQRSGGDCEGSMLVSVSRRSQEILYDEVQTSTTSTSSLNSKAWWVIQEVRDLHSSDESAVMAVERRRGAYVDAIHRRKGGGDGE